MVNTQENNEEFAAAENAHDVAETLNVEAVTSAAVDAGEVIELVVAESAVAEDVVDSGSVEPASTESASAEPATAEPATAESVAVESATVESATAEAAVDTESADGVEAVVGTEAAAEEVATEEVAEEAATPEEAEKVATAKDGLPLVLPLADMTAEERFRATTRLIFLAPDVPPVQPRSRRTELRRLDDILDHQFPGNDVPERGRDRELGRDRDSSRGRDSSRDRDRDSGRDNDRDWDRDRDRDRDRGDREIGSTRNRRRTTNNNDHDDDDSRRSPRQAPVITEPQKIKGSTRLEAKKQRRRDGRDAGRRRTVITESEFLARRESVDREMIVRTTADRIQIGVLEDKVLVEHYVARSSESSLIGNVYLGRVQNVLPSMEAAFVDIGRGRNAVLYSGEVDWSEFEGGNTARKIENALKPGDLVLVQVTKDPVGHKGARLTSQISLPGRFLVYVPGGAMNGISRKLPDTERARLKKILKEVLPSGAGVIVRTAAEGASEDQLTHDVQRLARQWETIQARVAKGTGPAMLHSEPDMLIKIVRDVFNEDFQRMVIEGSETHQVIEDYLSAVAPELMKRVERYELERDIFDEYRVTEQIAKALDRKVWLPSGGSLVIDRTEAMTVVDVNTGKFVGAGGNLEETVTKNNLEAAEEIVRQLRLRDIGGIIVVDFIDMVLESNRDLVLRRMVECLGRDRTKHQVAEVTSLGLVQMTRKKLGLGLLESFSDPCDVCAGRGVIVHHEPVQRHRSESTGRSKRGGNSSGGGGNSGGTNSNNGKSGGGEPKAHTHAITDGAKNMLAQVAASTIVGAKAGEHEEPAVAPAAPAAAKVAPADSVLASVLDALPEAPQAGASKTRARRASSRATAPAGRPKVAQEDASEVPASNAQVVDPERTLLDALDAKIQN